MGPIHKINNLFEKSYQNIKVIYTISDNICVMYVYDVCVDMLLYVQNVCSLCLLTVNVALNKPAYQQYPYRPGDDTYDASNAVDGRTSDLGFGGGQCAVSRSRQTATWWVDLTTIHSIYNIIMYFRTDNNLQGIVTFYSFIFTLR